MPVNELFRHDLSLFKAASGTDTRQVPAGSVTIDLYWKGATVSAGSSGTIGHVVAVYDPGTFSVSDTVSRNRAGLVGTVTAVGATSITVTWGGPVTVVVGDRLVLITRASGATRPSAYSDSQGTVSLGSSATSSATGGANFYTRPREIDLVVVVDSVTQVLPDQTGTGGATYDLWDFGLVADGSTDDAAALTRFVAYATLKGKTEVQLPAATVQVNSTVTISTSMRLKGAGRGATKIQGTAGITVLSISASDCLVEALTVTRSATGSAGSRLIQVTGARTALHNLTLERGAIGIYDNGVATSSNDVDCTGLGWESFYYAVASVSPIVTALRGSASNTIALANGGIRIDRATNCRFIACDVEPSASATCPALRIENTAGQEPSATFVACKFVGSNVVGADGPVVVMTAGIGVRFIGCDVSDGTNGYHINGAAINDVQIIGGSVVGNLESSINLDAGRNVHIVELLSSDCNMGSYADARGDHINVAAGVDDFSVNGLTVGNIVRGSAIAARDGESLAMQIAKLRRYLDTRLEVEVLDIHISEMEDPE